MACPLKMARLWMRTGGNGLPEGGEEAHLAAVAERAAAEAVEEVDASFPGFRLRRFRQRFLRPRSLQSAHCAC